MFMCVLGVIGAMPPVAAFFTPSSCEKAATFVFVRVTLTSLNWMRASVTSPFHGAGTLERSGFVAR